MNDLSRPAMTLDMMIAKYVALRDKKELVEDRHKHELAPFREMMNRLEAYMLEAMNQQNLKSIRSPGGTAFVAERTSATVMDWPATLDFIRRHGVWELLEARVSKKAVQAVMAETNCPVPGVETKSEMCVNVRRPVSKGP
jgi:hypothetical protein